MIEQDINSTYRKITVFARHNSDIKIDKDVSFLETLLNNTTGICFQSTCDVVNFAMSHEYDTEMYTKCLSGRHKIKNDMFVNKYREQAENIYNTRFGKRQNESMSNSVSYQHFDVRNIRHSIQFYITLDNNANIVDAEIIHVSHSNDSMMLITALLETYPNLVRAKSSVLFNKNNAMNMKIYYYMKMFPDVSYDEVFDVLDTGDSLRYDNLDAYEKDPSLVLDIMRLYMRKNRYEAAADILMYNKWIINNITEDELYQLYKSSNTLFNLLSYSNYQDVEKSYENREAYKKCIRAIAECVRRDNRPILMQISNSTLENLAPEFAPVYKQHFSSKSNVDRLSLKAALVILNTLQDMRDPDMFAVADLIAPKLMGSPATIKRIKAGPMRNYIKLKS